MQTKGLADADALRAHLDELNEAGTDDRAVGLDREGQPFLAFLAGLYAGDSGVITCDPWDYERNGELACYECNAARSGQLDTLNYPVTVLLRDEL